MLAGCMALGCVSCGKSVKASENSSDSSSQTTTTTTTTAVTTVSEDSSEVVTSVTNKPELMEQIVIGNYITYEKYAITKQAEDGKLSGTAKTATDREGFRGKSYVTGLTAPEQWQIEFDMPSSQYYNVAVSVASDSKIKTSMCMDGKKLSEFTTTGNGHFEIITVKNNYFEKGKHTLTLGAADPQLDIDFCDLVASSDISDIKFQLTNPRLANADSDYGTKAVYSYLCSSFGENVILGQHDTVASNTESEFIANTTGRYPAVRFGDMMMVTQDAAETMNKETQCAEKYASDGGLVGYMWHWYAPMGKKGYYTEDTDFDLSKAVTEEDIAELPIEQIEKLKNEKKISEECLAIIKDIDTVSEKLNEFKHKGITVIWRPLHEASNGYFWWGKDAASYKWLWKLLFLRQTRYHKLNNLIWVWSAQNAGWYVGDGLCDIVSVDIYDKGNTSGNVNSLLFLRSITKRKPCAISECGNFPSIQSIADQRAMWSYIAQWGGNFLMKEDGSLNEEYNTKEQLQLMYNNNRTVTRDKLPDFKKLAEQIKQKEEEQQKTQTTTTAAAVPADGQTHSSTTAVTTAP